MTFRNTMSASLLGGVAAVFIFSAAAIAQDKVDPADAQDVTDGRADRFSLVAIDGDILRVDRQNGTVSICEEQNDAWRCNPVPLAEEAYIAEINELADEVDRLTARLEELEDDGAGKPLPPATVPGRPQTGEGDKPSRLDKEDEEELEKVLTFTESAMRRFFGMVRELQKEFEEEGR
ncbi:hypothetical protein [Roseibium salinum]|uniref:Uncharacterized protein n=1 Tax=Roseibium salinum TaxID=1604349 RepID=A0ABT3R3I7_9HYPH|nr:hypothetical protein [Roseibium sp. DSM 29163]MCX2723623.1 hypothetical protein [Roseibium sp. DSM 29163]